MLAIIIVIVIVIICIIVTIIAGDKDEGRGRRSDEAERCYPAVSKQRSKQPNL